MSNEIATLETAFEGKALRVIMRDDEPWWVLTEVCKLLEIANPRHAGTRLDPDEKTAVGIMDTWRRQKRHQTIINESGLYNLLSTSRLPAAKRFSKWVRSEVLPSIRKTGHYGGAPAAEAISQQPPPTQSGLPDLPSFRKLDPFRERAGDMDAVARHYAWELVTVNYRREHAKLVAFIEAVQSDQPHADPVQIARFAADNPYLLDHPALFAWASSELHRLK
jgi:prophage antirepressor-like protein